MNSRSLLVTLSSTRSTRCAASARRSSSRTTTRSPRSKTSRSQRTRRNMRGATLIEVLVAFLLLAFGILGLSGLQINAQKNNQISLQRSQASMLACFLIDSMRANRKAAINGDYN